MQTIRTLLNSHWLRMFTLAAFTLSAFGCVGQQSFSNTARTGDSVMLALGGSASHQTGSFVHKPNLNVTITDSIGASYPVKLRNLFKLYSDPTNRFNYNSTFDTSQAPPWLSRYYRTPNQGEWVAIVDLTDPTTGYPLPLQSGPATLVVNSPDLVSSVLAFNSTDTDGNLQEIAINIIPGTGTPHAFNSFANPSGLEPLPQIQVAFDASKITGELTTDASTATKIGAIELTLTFDRNYFTNSRFPPMVRGNIEEPRVTTHSRTTIGNGTLKIILMEPQHGVIASPDPNNLLNTDPGLLKYASIKNMKAFIAWDPTHITGEINSTNYSSIIQIVSYRVMGINGEELLDVAGDSLVTPVIEASFN